jgi:hypothetical protein
VRAMLEVAHVEVAVDVEDGALAEVGHAETAHGSAVTEWLLRRSSLA